MEKISQITTGKAKSLYTTNEADQLIMEFRDDTSAFDGKKIELCRMPLSFWLFFRLWGALEAVFWASGGPLVALLGL